MSTSLLLFTLLIIYSSLAIDVEDDEQPLAIQPATLKGNLTILPDSLTNYVLRWTNSTSLALREYIISKQKTKRELDNRMRSLIADNLLFMTQEVLVKQYEMYLSY
jgi:hypothetical protein